MTALVAIIHAGLAAAWVGGMAYSLFVVQPKLKRYFGPDQEGRETLTAVIASGNRWKVVGLIAAITLSGLVLLLMHQRALVDPRRQGLVVALCNRHLLVRLLAALAAPGVRDRGGSARAPTPADRSRDHDAGADRTRVRSRSGRRPPMRFVTGSAPCDHTSSEMRTSRPSPANSAACSPITIRSSTSSTGKRPPSSLGQLPRKRAGTWSKRCPWRRGWISTSRTSAGTSHRRSLSAVPGWRFLRR